MGDMNVQNMGLEDLEDLEDLEEAWFTVPIWVQNLGLGRPVASLDMFCVLTFVFSGCNQLGLWRLRF